MYEYFEVEPLLDSLGYVYKYMTQWSSKIDKPNVDYRWFFFISINIYIYDLCAHHLSQTIIVNIAMVVEGRKANHLKKN